MIEWLSQYSGYAALIAFFIVFTAVAIWVYLPSNKAEIEKHRDIPFKGD